MKKLFSGLFGRLRLTTVVAGMVIGGIFFSIAAISSTLFYDLSASVQTTTAAKVQDTMRLAATIFKINMPTLEMSVNDDGKVEKLVLRAMPRLRNTDMVDQISSVAREVITMFSYDAETAVFSRASTSIRPDATIAADGATQQEPARDATPLDPAGPVYASLLAGQPYEGIETLAGTPHRGLYMPVVNVNDQTVGAVFVGVEKSAIEASVNDSMKFILSVCAVVLFVSAILALILSRALIRPIPILTGVMSKLAAGDLDTEVPYVDYRNEIGTMAKAVGVFRENALQIDVLNEQETTGSEQRRLERATMMQDLQRAFGTVVQAAVGGDFSQRITTKFADDELNALADGVNELVETVDNGLSATGVVLAALAEADLSVHMEGEFGGAFGKLQSDTNAVANKLADIVGQLKATSASLKTASSEILSGANDLSDRTTRQASTIEETSAAMEQLASTVGDNARKAEDASAKAHLVSKAAEAGGAVMGQANEAMLRITDSSGKISNIIGLIDDIAFQTNLLALNASVEAARAGDAGKGFAVVAVEVRRLAQSAASASSDVKLLIEQSATEVNGGSKLVSDAAEKLASMLEAVRHNNESLDAIARASREQASSIEEVNTAVRQMDEMTQHNAALVEEMNAAIEQSEQQATHLDDIVDIFVVEDATPMGKLTKAA